MKEFVERNSIHYEIKGFHINFGLLISNRVEKVVREQVKLGISIGKLAKEESGRPICSICGGHKKIFDE